ncbi:hypothetical protein DH2020_043579 [Rehmannia glutinosa]|uniref:Survival protein SurE-like phosphatase/nucleotidase domain-containing protein n=1 Tax=Rehmannia glutinosa TaxID=99300 RepID=A0ABR0UKH7_REHGL
MFSRCYLGVITFGTFADVCGYSLKVLPLGVITSEKTLGTPADCTSLGISKALFPSIPDLVISGINMGSNCGYNIIYSGTVAGAREAFLNKLPSVSISYDWVEGRSNINDFTLAAEASLPIICAILAGIKTKTYPQNCFLNVDIPTNVVNNKGYRLAKQGKSIVKWGWKQVTSDAEGGKFLSTMTMETNSESDYPSAKREHLLFKREVKGYQVEDGDTDYCSLKEGYITVSPLGALSPAEMDTQAYFKQWLPSDIHKDLDGVPLGVIIIHYSWDALSVGIQRPAAILNMPSRHHFGFEAMSDDTAQIRQQIDLLAKQVHIVRIKYDEIKRFIENRFLGICEFAYDVVPIHMNGKLKTGPMDALEFSR